MSIEPETENGTPKRRHHLADERLADFFWIVIVTDRERTADGQTLRHFLRRVRASAGKSIGVGEAAI
jgi:hypothetical protein